MQWPDLHPWQRDFLALLQRAGNLRLIRGRSRSYLIREPQSLVLRRESDAAPGDMRVLEWTCPHGVLYSGTMDFISGARNAHDELSGLHPDFGRWIGGELSEDEYADSLAARVDAAVSRTDTRYKEGEVDDDQEERG